MIPQSSQAAYDGLVEDQLFDIQSDLTELGKLGDAAFCVRFHLPSPNEAGLPVAADVRVTIPANFPFTKVAFTPLNQALRGFPHQSGETGDLCLRPANEYPTEPRPRLRAYVRSAEEWFNDAANGVLLQPGQLWELPDFRIGRKDRPRKVYFLESPASFEDWDGRIGFSGTVQLIGHRHGHGWVPVRFDDPRGSAIHVPVGESFLDRGLSMLATWFLLPSLVVERHRPAGSFRELETLCSSVGIDLWDALRRALKSKPVGNFHYLLVGAPIPRLVGDAPSEVHWQPIAFPTPRTGPLAGGRHTKRRSDAEKTFRARMRGTLVDQAVPWGPAENLAPARVASRGALDEGVRGRRVSLFGCGAVGSVLAEHLVRGASHDVALFDDELVDLENLPRHTLGGSDVGKSKSLELARRLSGIHAPANIRGYLTALPMLENPARADRPARAALDASDVYIDCTAHDATFQWASKLGRERGQQVVHLFIGPEARFLTICTSGRHAACFKVAEGLFEDISTGRAPFSWEEYDPPTTEVTPGAGCWKGTFPARGFDIAALVASAVPILEQILLGPWRSHGHAVVLRRRDIRMLPEGNFDVAGGKGIIDVAWQGQYR